MSSTLACILWIGSLITIDAESAIVDAVVEVGSSTLGVSALNPTLRPVSDKKFFGKDYPNDKRPKVDVLHFNHPYPVVQDSDDFDADYVKDENHDNGEYKAQTEYDRLRHKLLKEKADVAKALAAKTEAENELHDAIKREKAQEDKQKKAQEKEDAKKKTGTVQGGEAKEAVKKSSGEYTVPGAKSPGGVSTPGVVNVEPDDVQKKMDELERCKKQLAEAREKLKKLMEELEAAKAEQDQMEAAVDAASEQSSILGKKQQIADAKAKEEYEEYLEAKEAYDKQQATVAKMEADIRIASEKVRAFRDASDKEGGVYPTSQRSGSASHSLLIAALSAAALLFQ